MKRTVLFMIVMTLLASSVNALTFSEINWGILVGNFFILFILLFILANIIPGIRQQLQENNSSWNSSNVQRNMIYIIISVIALFFAFKYGAKEVIWKALQSNVSISWLFWANNAFTMKPLINIVIFSLLVFMIKSLFYKEAFKDDNFGQAAFVILTIILSVSVAHSAAFDNDLQVDKYLWDIDFILKFEKFLLGDREGPEITSGHTGYYKEKGNFRYGILVPEANPPGEELHRPLWVFIFAVALYLWLFTEFITIESKTGRWLLTLFLGANAANSGTSIHVIAGIAYVIFIFALKSKFEDASKKSWAWSWAFGFAIVDTISDTVVVGGQPLTPFFMLWLNQFTETNPFIYNMIFGFLAGMFFKTTSGITGIVDAVDQIDENIKNNRKKRIKDDAEGYFASNFPWISGIGRWIKHKWTGDIQISEELEAMKTKRKNRIKQKKILLQKIEKIKNKGIPYMQLINQITIDINKVWKEYEKIFGPEDNKLDSKYMLDKDKFANIIRKSPASISSLQEIFSNEHNIDENDKITFDKDIETFCNISLIKNIIASKGKLHKKIEKIQDINISVEQLNNMLKNLGEKEIKTSLKYLEDEEEEKDEKETAEEAYTKGVADAVKTIAQHGENKPKNKEETSNENLTTSDSNSQESDDQPAQGS